jgi:hypothetical protein
MKSMDWVIRFKDLVRNWGLLRGRAVGFAAVVGEPASRLAEQRQPTSVFNLKIEQS